MLLTYNSRFKFVKVTSYSPITLVFSHFSSVLPHYLSLGLQRVKESHATREPPVADARDKMTLRKPSEAWCVIMKGLTGRVSRELKPSIYYLIFIIKLLWDLNKLSPRKWLTALSSLVDIERRFRGATCLFVLAAVRISNLIKLS